MNNTIFILLFRLMHIIGGGLWFGVAVFYLFFIHPSVQSIGPASAQFTQTLNNRKKYPLFMSIITTATIFSGIALYWISSGGFNFGWIQSDPGIGYSLGALAGISAFFIGGFGISSAAGALGALKKEIVSKENEPNNQQALLLNKLEKKLLRIEIADFIFLAAAMIFMATARYWNF